MNLKGVSRSRNIIKKTYNYYFIYMLIFYIYFNIHHSLLIFVVTRIMKNISVIIDNTTLWICVLRCN